MKSPEAQWVLDSIKGDQHAFAELVRNYTPQIYNFVYRLCGNVQTAEDVTQETFIKVWKSLKKYDSNQSFRAWIFTIARNTTTDHLRKKTSVPFSNLDYEDRSFDETISDTTEHVEQQFGKIEDVEYFKNLVAQLEPNYQTVLTLYYQNNLTFDEIGQVLGKSINTVKSQHRRALIKLRELMKSAPNNPYSSYE